MSDEEIICSFMEPRPADGRGDRVETPPGVRWWYYNYQTVAKPSGVGKEFTWQWYPREMDLDRIWEVEERLPEEQRLDYWLELSKGGPAEFGYWRIVHADTPTRTRALVVVIQGRTNG